MEKITKIVKFSCCNDCIARCDLKINSKVKRVVCQFAPSGMEDEDITSYLVAFSLTQKSSVPRWCPLKEYNVVLCLSREVENG